MDKYRNNIKIAKFTGAEEDKLIPYFYPVGVPKSSVHKKKLQYHFNLNWLMDVVDIIENLPEGNFTVNISKYSVRIYKISEEEELIPVTDKTFGTYAGTRKIDALYKAIIDFIDWYNLNYKK